MGLFEFVSKIIEYIVWPATVLVLVCMLKEPLRKLIPLIEKLKYKDFELSFRQQLETVKENIQSEAKDTLTVTNDLDIKLIKLVDISPKAGIQEAWQRLENTARVKLDRLLPSTINKIRSIHNAIDYLENTGALIPSTARALQDMQDLRNQAAHLTDFALSKEDAIEYIRVAGMINKQIEAIEELPKVNLAALTLLILEINHLIDTKKYFDITISDIHEAIESRSVLNFLKEKANGDIDLSLFVSTNTFPDFEEFYNEQLQQIYNAYGGSERRKWKIENLGLCLLVAWTNEIIQLGAGWYPND